MDYYSDVWNSMKIKLLYNNNKYYSFIREHIIYHVDDYIIEYKFTRYNLDYLNAFAFNKSIKKLLEFKDLSCVHSSSFCNSQIYSEMMAFKKNDYGISYAL